MSGNLDAIRSDLRELRRAVVRPEFRDVTAANRIVRRLPLKPTPVEPRGRCFQLIAATQQPDRNNGDVLMIDGLHVEHFLRHDRGRLCWAHDRGLRVGRVILLGKHLDDPVPYLTATIELDRGPLADRIFERYRDGSLTAVSISYNYIRHHRPSVEERRCYDVRPGGLILDEASLLEVSVVEDPADVGSRVLGDPATSAGPGR